MDTTEDGGPSSTAPPAVPVIGVPTQETQVGEEHVMKESEKQDDRGSATYLLSTFVQSDSAVYL